MPLQKWATLSSEHHFFLKILRFMTRYFNRRFRLSLKTKKCEAGDAVVKNPLLLKKILENLDSSSLLQFRRVNHTWLFFCDELLIKQLGRNHLQINFQSSSPNNGYYLNATGKWWMHNNEKSLEKFTQFLQQSSSTRLGKFPSFATFRFEDGDLSAPIPQNFFTHQEPCIERLTLDLFNCWNDMEIGIQAQINVISQLLQSQLTSLTSLYIQSLPNHWTTAAYLGKLFPQTDDTQISLSRLQLFQIGHRLVFIKRKVFSLLEEIVEAAPNLRYLIFRTWEFTHNNLFYSVEFMKRCISLANIKSDVIMGASYVCMDIFMVQTNLFEQFSHCNLKIALVYLCESRMPQRTELDWNGQKAIYKILKRNRKFLRELIINRSELIGLTKLDLPVFPNVVRVSVGRGKYERKFVRGYLDEDGRLEEVEQKWNVIFEVFPKLENLHLQMSAGELVKVWGSGKVTWRMKSHQKIEWEGICYKKGGEKQRFVHN